ncbi:MAG: hypothetical protein V4555_14720 [Acidobacteriota bacterium]
MLSLDDAHWSELQHAYGSAADMPALLHQLERDPSSEPSAEPWFSLWSALAHQGDVYPASFAAVPHIVRLIRLAPFDSRSAYFHFVSWIEICRQRNAVDVPADLLSDYQQALAAIPALVCEAAAYQWNHDFQRCALSALAVAKGDTELGAAIQELEADVLPDFFEWFQSR